VSERPRLGSATLGSTKLEITALEITPVTTEDDWRDAHHVRWQVFVVGQECPPEEEFDRFDGLDAPCRHVVGRLDGRPVATARWRVAETQGRRVAKLERFAVLEEHRGRGFGKALVRHLMAEARARGHRDFLLEAQDHLRDFYGSFGFRPVGEVFELARIPHVKMVRFSEDP
jgi:predicted GNAT family N-acyltransferase